MVIIGFFLLVLVDIFDLTFVSGQEEPRTICKDLMPVIVKIQTPPSGVTIKSPTSWIVAKTTKMKRPYPPGFDENMNTCRPQTYGPKCLGIHYLRVPDNSGNGYTTHVYADHQTEKENYVHFVDYFESKDSEYQMYQGFFKNMEFVIDEIQPGTPVETIPDFVKNDHGGRIIAVVDMPANGRWLILTTCDKQFTMVVLNWQFPITDSPQTIWARSQTKINEKLVSLGIDLSTMVDLPLDSFKFKMYEANYGKNRSKVTEPSTSGGEGTSKQAEINSEDTITQSRSRVGEPSTSGGGGTNMQEEIRADDTTSRSKLKSTFGDGESSTSLTMDEKTKTEITDVKTDNTNVGESSSRN